MMPKVFVNCPTIDIKEYCLKDYAAGVKALTYPNITLLLGDNSKNEAYFYKLKEVGLDAIRTPWSETARKRIVDARNILREKFLELDCEYFFSLEQDVIPLPDVIELL